MTKSDALNELNQPLYDPIELERDRDFFIKKLGLTQDEYHSVMSSPPNSYVDFDNNEANRLRIRKALRYASKIKQRLHTGIKSNS